MLLALDHMPKDMYIRVCNTIQESSVGVKVRVLSIPFCNAEKKLRLLNPRHLHNRRMKGKIYFFAENL